MERIISVLTTQPPFNLLTMCAFLAKLYVSLSNFPIARRRTTSSIEAGHFNFHGANTMVEA